MTTAGTLVNPMGACANAVAMTVAVARSVLSENILDDFKEAVAWKMGCTGG